MPAHLQNATASDRPQAHVRRSKPSPWRRLTQWARARWRLRNWQRRSRYTYELPPSRGPTELHRVLSRELEYINHHRHPDQNIEMTQRSMVGLALSGGGIRSATTNLGILQALSRMEVLPPRRLRQHGLGRRLHRYLSVSVALLERRATGAKQGSLRQVHLQARH